MVDFYGPRKKISTDRITPTEILDTDAATNAYIDSMAAVMRQEKNFGHIPPIEVYRNKQGIWEVVDGHHRLEAAKRAGIPVEWVDAPVAKLQLWLRFKGRTE